MRTTAAWWCALVLLAALSDAATVETRSLEDPRASDSEMASDSDQPQWAIDSTVKLPRSEFIKMGSLIATKQAIDLGWRHALNAVYVNDEGRYGDIVPGGLNGRADDDMDVKYGGPYSFQARNPKVGSEMTTGTIETGNDDDTAQVHLNAGPGAAFAHCYSIEVDDNVERKPFRLCNNFEVQAITAMVEVPLQRSVVTYSGVGEKYVLGQFVGELGLEGKFMSSFGVSGTGLYVNGKFVMQAYAHANDEVGWEYWTDDLVGYCCSGEYLSQDGAGAT